MSKANLAYASALRDSRNSLFNQGQDIDDYQSKQRSRSGWGRLAGGLLGTVAALATGGAAIPAWQLAVAAGLGSRVGNEVGERSVKGRKKFSSDNLLFGGEKVKRQNRDLDNYYRDFNTNQWMQAGSDAVAAYMGADTAKDIWARGGAAKDMGMNPLQGAFNTKTFNTKLTEATLPKAKIPELVQADTVMPSNNALPNLSAVSPAQNYDYNVLEDLYRKKLASTPAGQLGAGTMSGGGSVRVGNELIHVPPLYSPTGYEDSIFNNPYYGNDGF